MEAPLASPSSLSNIPMSLRSLSNSCAAAAVGLLALLAVSVPAFASANIWDYTYCMDYGYPNLGDCQSMGYGGGYGYGGYDYGYDYYYPQQNYSYYQQPSYSYHQPTYYQQPTYYYPQQQYYHPNYYQQPSYSYSYDYGAPIVMVNSGVYYGGYVY